MSQIVDCPMAESHGNPFRYCQCGWAEPSPLLDLIRQRFEYHPATEVTGPLHDRIRAAHIELAVVLAQVVPAGRHQSLAFTALQESMMWANAGIAVDTPTAGA